MRGWHKKMGPIMCLTALKKRIYAAIFYAVDFQPALHPIGRPGSSEVPRNPLTRWDVSSIPANGIFLTKKLKNKNKNAQRVEND